MLVNIVCFCGKIHNTVTAQCYAGSSHSTCKMITIIVSVLNEIKRLVCLFHSDSHILIDQGTNIIEITKMGEI